MDQVFTFDKSLQERLREYTDIFSNEPIPVSQLKQEWSFYLELVVDPNGWQAIWKLPRFICEEYKISYPTLVLVYVESINFKELTAVTKILAVEDEDIHLPDKHEVKLIQLWPTKDQDETVGLNITSTANALDMLRFFYNNILLPWDFEDDDPDWLTKNLESRLRLYYDMRNGVIPKQTAEYMSSLLSEAKCLQTKYEIAKKKIDKIDYNSLGDLENGPLHPLVCINVSILQIRNEIKPLENPLMRKTLLQMEKNNNKKPHKLESGNWVVYPQGKPKKYIEFLHYVENRIGKKKFNFSVSLISALENGNSNDTFILNPSKHEIKNMGALEGGGALLGLYEPDITIIFNKNDIMLNCNGENILFENLTIDARASQYAIVVRMGKVTVKNCKIIGSFESSTQQGIIAFSGSSLELQDCEISGFSTAITGNSGSAVILKGCKVFSVNNGLKAFEGCKVLVQNTNFHDCYGYGICIETEKISYNIGGFSILEGVPDIEVKDVTGKNNTKGDAIIHQKMKLKPFRDLFSNPELDPTITHNVTVSDATDASGAEDNGFDSTVIEKKVID